MTVADQGKSNWRNYLTSSELADLGALEANAQRLAKRRRALSAEIRLYRDRCLQRRRQAYLKTLEPQQ